MQLQQQLGYPEFIGRVETNPDSGRLKKMRHQ